MPLLLTLVEQVKGEYLGESTLFTDDTSTRFHIFSQVMPMVLDVARETAVQLLFPRYNLSFTVASGSNSLVYDSGTYVGDGPEFISRVLRGSFGGFSVAEGSLGQVVDYQGQLSAAFPRLWSWDSRVNTFTWGPDLSSGGVWSFEVVADDYLRLDPLLGGTPPRLSFEDFEILNPSIYADWLNRELWDGLHSEWSQVVKFGALMRLFLKERNTEQTEIYASLFRDSLVKFAEFLRVPVPGSLMKEDAS